MNHAEIVEHVAEKNFIAKAKAKELVDSMIEGFAATLRAGGEVHLRGLGRLKVKSLPARDCRNPRTGAQIHVGPTQKLAVSTSKRLFA